MAIFGGRHPYRGPARRAEEDNAVLALARAGDAGSYPSADRASLEGLSGRCLASLADPANRELQIFQVATVEQEIEALQRVGPLSAAV